MDMKINIVVFNAIILALDLFVFWKTFRNRNVNRKTAIFNRLCFTTCVLQALTLIIHLLTFDIISWPLVPKYLVYILMFNHMALPAFFATYYLIFIFDEQTKITRLQYAILTIPATVLITSSILSPWTKWVFYIDENLEYHRGTAFALQIICPYLYMIAITGLAIVTIKRHKKEGMVHKVIGHYCSFIIPTIIGVILQVCSNLNGGYSIIGISIGMVCLFLEQYIFEIQENQRLLAIRDTNAKLEEINEIQKEQLQIVNALSQDYATVFLIDTTDGSSRPFKQIGIVHDVLGYNDGEKHMYQESVNKYIEKRFYSEDKEAMYECSKLDVVMRELEKKDEFSGNFRTQDEDGIIHYFQFKYRKIKDTNYIILGYQNIDDLVEEERERNEKLISLNSTLKQRMDIIQSMASIYFASFYVSIKDNTFVELNNVEFVRDAIGVRGNAQESLLLIADTMMREDLAQGYRDFVNFKTLDERMRNKSIITYDYYGHNLGWCQMAIIRGVSNTSGKLENILIAVRTIHDEKEREEKQKEELNKALIEAKDANEAKTSFLFNMSHDIRTPMNAIIGFTELLKKYQDNPEKRMDYLKKIEDSSGILLSIINNVLEMARIEKGTIVLDERAWSTEQFSDSVYSVFSEMMKQKNIEFTSEINVTHHYVYCDASKIREIFINILSNAYKYTNPGGKVHMSVDEIPTDIEGKVIYQITVSDTGIGMDESFIPHIFEEFSREHNTTQNKIEGTGLGMAIVKKLIDYMNGTIEVKSKLGEGSTFIVTLSFSAAEKGTLVDYGGVQIDPAVFKNKRILLAEDNELNAEIAIELLSEVNFIVERAENGQVCVDMLKEHPAKYYDVILMDIQMPVMNGYEATRAIRLLEDDEKSLIPILAMTANAFTEDKKEALRSGMNGHLAKPIDLHELLRELARILG